jgi:hypothetical protein
VKRLALAFSWFFSILFGDGLRRIEELEAPRPAEPAPAPRRAEEPKPKPQPAPAADTSALRLLAVLQAEGRLIDFLMEDIASYTDEQVGGAVRAIHAGCRKALGEAVVLGPVLGGQEGESVTVQAGFDPAAIRLVGDVSGKPPFVGVLQHHGWRAVKVHLPKGLVEQDPAVIAAAEVEV